MEKVVQGVLESIRCQDLLHAGDRVGVAVSGGADSVALLRIMLELRPELGIVLSVVHFNHKLRGAEAEADEQFVAQLAHRHKLELHVGSGDVAAHARNRHLSTEAAARQLRYQYFRQLFEEQKLNRIATGHTLDDQAETVLLRIVRGAGTRGLAGIYPQLRVQGSQFSVVRPLLQTRRRVLEIYLAEIGQDWREDSSNRDLRHARNRVRHGIVPRLERTLNPSVRETLAETADIARSEEEYWQKEVDRVLPEVWQAERRTFEAGRTGGLASGLAAAGGEGGSRVAGLAARVPSRGRDSGARPRRSPGPPRCRRGGLFPWATGGLQFDSSRAAAATNSDYEYTLSVPGAVEVPEAGTWFEAALVSGERKLGL